MNELLLLNTRPLARRSPLAISVLLHAALIALAAFIDAGAVKETSPAALDRRSVTLLNLRDLPDPVHRTVRPPLPSQPAARAGQSASEAPSPFQAASGVGNQNPGSADDQPLHLEHPRRTFRLSAAVPVVQQKQIIVQTDVPPEIVLKQEVPLPNIIVWTQQELPKFRRRFVAPPPRQDKPKVIAQNIPPAPELQPPNNELNVADLKMAALLAAQNPRLLVPPATTAPIRIPNAETTSQTPQVIPADPSLSPSAALIALSDSPIRPNGMIIVPPANQTPGSFGSAHPGQGNGGGSQPSGKGASKTGEHSGSGSGGTGTGGAGALAIGGQPGAGTGNAPGLGEGAALSGGLGANNLAGLTRIALPKDGRYGVVVSGSSQAVPYPETVGALSGKMVYTVYLNVGLRKQWILQYCLTKEAASSIPRGSSTAVDAPWPFTIFRPDHLEQSGDYVIVHGQIDKEGRFEQLALVFPEQLEQKDLLMNALKIWAFRPASRDSVATAVEVLLIIPAQS